MAFPACTFCGKNDSKPSKEHIIPKWMAREFPDATFKIKNDLTQHTRTYKKYVHIIAHGPCERCNNEWMSDLEKLASPILIPLMHGESAMLTARDQAIIRTWFFMKTVMFDIHSEQFEPHSTHPDAQKPRPRYFEDSEHRALMSSLYVHPAYLVFIGRYRHKGHGKYKETHSDVNIAPRDNPIPSIHPIWAYAFTFMFEHLVLQIFCAKIDPGIGVSGPNFSRFSKLLGWPYSISFPPLHDFR